MSDVLSALCEALRRAADFPAALQVFVAYLRQADDAAAALRDFADVLKRVPDVRGHVARLLHDWLRGAALYAGVVQTGIYSRQGFFRELKRRVYDRINPPPRRANELGDVLQSVLRPADLAWLGGIAPLQWLMLYRDLDVDGEGAAARDFVRAELLYAAELLALWIAAEDLDPDLLRLSPALLEHDSPFIGLQREVQVFVATVRRGEENVPDIAPLEVMLAQSRDQVARLSRLAAHGGASLSTAHLLQRLAQSLDRLEGLLAVVAGDGDEKCARAFLQQLAQIIDSGLQQRSIRGFFHSATGLLSRSISASKSHHGGHYITRTRREYGRMFAGAAGAGGIIAVMALLKILVGRSGLGDFAQMVLVSLNYGVGFVLVHVCGFTIATKQPAMTAASFAHMVEQGQNSRALSKELARLLVLVNRSQSIAAAGNVCVAMLVAALISVGFGALYGGPLLSASESAYQLKALQPVPALWYAAIAAVWLFCAGIIAGYYDNRAEYLQLRERLAVHPALAFLGDARRVRFAGYMHAHFGALHGNFFFGILLGVTPYVGHLLGLPLDIRHIAFSSANVSYGGISGDWALGAWLLAVLYVLLIGLVNLWVSFLLALKVALRAREAALPGARKMLQAVWAEIRRAPGALFFPPRDGDS